MGHTITTTTRASEVADGLISIGGLVDRSDQSRFGLMDTLNEIRDLAADLYGNDYETDLLEVEGYEVEQNTLDDDDDPDQPENPE